MRKLEELYMLLRIPHDFRNNLACTAENYWTATFPYDYIRFQATILEYFWNVWAGGPFSTEFGRPGSTRGAFNIENSVRKEDWSDSVSHSSAIWDESYFSARQWRLDFPGNTTTTNNNENFKEGIICFNRLRFEHLLNYVVDGLSWGHYHWALYLTILMRAIFVWTVCWSWSHH